MSLASSAAGDDQKRLRDGSKVILQILRSLFGESAKIKITPRQSPEIGGTEQKDVANLDEERGGAEKSEADEATSNQAASKFDADDAQENLSQNAQEPELSNLTGNLFSDGSEERTATPSEQNLDAKFESGEQDEQTENLTPQTQADILQTANDAAPSAQTNSDSPMGEAEPLNLNENESNLTRSSQMDLNQPAEPKFAPDFESMRDDTHDFHEAYSLKFKSDDGVAAGADLAFLDDELRRLESQNSAKTEQKPSGTAKFNQNSAPQTATFGELPFDPDDVSEMFSEAVEYDDGLFGRDANEPASATEGQNLDTSNLSGDEFQNEANFDDSSLSEANLNTQNPAPNLAAKTQTDPKAAKNQAVLKEAKRLFGEPEVLEI